MNIKKNSKQKFVKIGKLKEHVHMAIKLPLKLYFILI